MVLTSLVEEIFKELVMVIGKYTIIYHEESKKIMVENKKGEKIRIHYKVYKIILIHERAEMIVFSHYLNRKKWRYKDSRSGNCNRKHIIDELNRMLKINYGQELVTNWFGNP